MNFPCQLYRLLFKRIIRSAPLIGLWIFLSDMTSVNSRGQMVNQPEITSTAQWNIAPSSTAITIDETTGGLLRGSESAGWTAKAEIKPEQKIIRDGFVSFKLLPGKALAVGLCMDSGGLERVSDFGLLVKEDQSIHRLSGDTAVDLNYDYNLGDNLKIERTGTNGGTVRYIKNDTVMWTSTSGQCTGKMSIECLMWSPDASLTECKIYTGDLDADQMPDSWEKSQLASGSGWIDVQNFTKDGHFDGDDKTNIEEFEDGTSPKDSLSVASAVIWGQFANTASIPSSSGGLQKSSGGAAWNADAVAIIPVPEGSSSPSEPNRILADGRLAFKVRSNTSLALGFTVTNGARTKEDLEWAFVFSLDGSFNIRRSMDSPTDLEITGLRGRYSDESLFAIQRLNGKIQFFKDGVLLYSSSARSTNPLIVDCSLYGTASRINQARLYNGNLDGDALPDAWELAYLPETAGITDLQNFKDQGSADADPDGDSVANLFEYYFGTNPMNPLSFPPGVHWRPSSITALSVPEFTPPTGVISKVSPGTDAWNVDAVAVQSRFNSSPTPVPVSIGTSGSFSFTVSQPSRLIVGLNQADTSRSFDDIDHGILVNTESNAFVYESGSEIKPLGTYTPSTYFSIRRFLGSIEYYKNGVLFHVSTVPVSRRFILDSSFRAIGSQITSAFLFTDDLDDDGMSDEWEIRHWFAIHRSLPTFQQIRENFTRDGDLDGDSFSNLQEYLHGTDPTQRVQGLPATVVWEKFTNTVPSDTNGGLRKNAGGETSYNADATSTQFITQDGTLSFSPGLTTTGIPSHSLAVGFAKDNDPVNTTDNAGRADLEYAILLSDTGALIRRPETAEDLAVGSYTSQTVFSIRRKDKEVSYYKDGALLYTSTQTSSGDLWVDCSFLKLNHPLATVSLNNHDSDNDGINDLWEIAQLNANPANLNGPYINYTLGELQAFDPSAHLDSDGLSNAQEYLYGTNVWDNDTDDDLMPDQWEIFHGFDPLDPSNDVTDADSDGLSNLGEFQNNTDPRNPDSDGDGMPDGYEVDNTLNPLLADELGDRDGDGVPNLWEFSRGSNAKDRNNFPVWDAIVDGALNEDSPENGTYSNIDSAYRAVALSAAALNNPEYKSTILIKRYNSNYLGSLQATNTANLKYVAIVGEGGADRASGLEGVIYSNTNWNLKGNFVINGLIFEGTRSHSPGITINTDAGAASSAYRVHFGNCLFRNMQTERFAGDNRISHGALSNLGAKLSLEHCTFYRCSSYRTVSLDSSPESPQVKTPVATIAQVAGTLVLKNCILWDDVYQTDFPITGPVGQISVHSCLIQGGMLGSINQNPVLNVKAYPTAQSIHSHGAGGYSALTYDLHKQPRSQTTPTLGAVEWINSDASDVSSQSDSLPDWWENWWFNHLNHANNDITDPQAYIFLPTFHQATLIEHYFNFTRPAPSRDNDNLRDDWEFAYFGDLDETDEGNPDKDHRSNLQEQLDGTNPTTIDDDYDFDGDDLPDNWERQYFKLAVGSEPVPTGDLDPLRFGKTSDPDDDKWLNYEEFLRRTNPTIIDPGGVIKVSTDGDDMPDAWEMDVFGSLAQTNEMDFDDDGIANLEEYLRGSPPNVTPYDLDKNKNQLWDWWEIKHFTSLFPEGFDAAGQDPDVDGNTNIREMYQGSDPNISDGYNSHPDHHNFSINGLSNIPTYREDTFYFEGTINYKSWDKTYYSGTGEEAVLLPHYSGSNKGIRAFARKFVSPCVFISGGRSDSLQSNDFYSSGYWQDYRETGESEESCDVRMKITSLSKADRLIVKAFKRMLRGWGEIFYIEKGNSWASGPSLQMSVNPSDAKRTYIDLGNGHYSYSGSANEGLIEVPLPITRSLPPNDLAGPRYRKIGLNGVPTPDSLPGEQNQNSSPPEETFVDAYSRQLRHSTSDIWLDSDSSDLPIQVRRDLTPEVWSWNSGLRIDERPDRPFGPCWSTNLCPHIRLQYSPPDYEPAVPLYFTNGIVTGDYDWGDWEAKAFVKKMANPPQISLVDENGVSYTFNEVSAPEPFIIPGLSSANEKQVRRWVPAPNERFDCKTNFDRLVQVPAAASPHYVTQFELHKRNGTVCIYKRNITNNTDNDNNKCLLVQHIPSDRKDGDKVNGVFVAGVGHTYNYYFRMAATPPDSASNATVYPVTTAQGNSLVYTYDPNDHYTLYPSRISDPHCENRYIDIFQEDGRIVKITGPAGSEIEVNYSYTDTDKSNAFHRAAGGELTPMLYSVRAGINSTALTTQSAQKTVKYDYSYINETDPTPDAREPHTSTFGHIEVSQITDERNNSYRFNYALNQNTRYMVWNGVWEFQRKQVGIPRLLTKIIRPDNQEIVFTGERAVIMNSRKQVFKFSENPQAPEPASIETKVSGPGGTYQYTFSEPHTVQPAELVQSLNFFTGNVSDGDINEGVVYLSYKKMEIKSGVKDDGSHLGKETFLFNPQAGMALESATDMSGNKTTFRYEDSVFKNGVDNTGASSLGVLYYDDPTSEESPIHEMSRDPNDRVPGDQGEHNGIKRYAYDPKFRTRIATTNERFIKTVVTLNQDTGLPEQEEVYDLRVTDPLRLRSVKYKYGYPVVNPKFKSFLYEKTEENFIDPSFTVAVTPPDGSPPLVNKFVTRYVPDANGRIYSETRYPNGGEGVIVSKTSYNKAGQKSSVIDAREKETKFAYFPGTLRLQTITFPGNVTKKLRYDPHGNLTHEMDELGNITLHTYDIFNRRISTSVDLNWNQRLPEEVVQLPADPRYTHVDFDDHAGYNGDLITETTYNVFNLPVDVTDARGIVTHHDYDDIGRLLKTTVDHTNPDPNKRQVTEYTNGNTDPNDDFVGGSIFDNKSFKPRQIKDPRGFVTTFNYDKAYRVLSSTLTDTSYDPPMLVTTYTRYSDVGSPRYQIDARGRITETRYDGLNRPIETIFPMVDGEDVPSTTKTYYTSTGLVWCTVDEEGAQTLNFYDGAGRKTHVYAPAIPIGYNADPLLLQQLRPLTITQYDDAGNPTHVTDPLGRVTETIYDDRNRPIKIIAPSVVNVKNLALPNTSKRPTTENQYDAAGRIEKTIDPMDAETITKYDAAGRVWRTIAPQTGDQIHVTTHKLDPAGNILEITNPKKQTVTNTYDAFNRLLTTTQTEVINDITKTITDTFTYDEVGNRRSVKDGLNQTTLFTYDGQNRLLTQTFQNNDKLTYLYDGVHKVGQIDASQRLTEYGYDARGRLRTIASPDLNRTQTYDRTGRLKTITETQSPLASVEIKYNALGWITSETSAGLTHNYFYNLAGSRTHAHYGTGRLVTTTYDALNRPETITDNGRTTTYGYDLAGRAVSLLAANGNFSWNIYDQLGRLKQRTLYRSNSLEEPLATLEWDHDPLGNVLAQWEKWDPSTLRPNSWRVTIMTYDGFNRLFEETVSSSEIRTGTIVELTRTTYRYDKAHNRESKTVSKTVSGNASEVEQEDTASGFWSYHYNSANQLEVWQKFDQDGGTLLKAAQLTYDDEGNRKRQIISEGTTTRTTHYQWDAQNRLKGVTMPGIAAGDAITQYQYGYDYRTRRISTTRTGGGQPNAATTIAFAGGLSLAEWDTDGSGTAFEPLTPTVEYTRGPDMGGGVGGLLYSSRSSSGSPSRTLKYNLSNGRGDIVAQSNSAGALTWTASYEAYGKRTRETGENKDKQRANSKDEDPTGLLNEGFRYRDIETGVWLSRDPAGFVDGPNLYAYVQQNPWTSFDPDGLFLSAIVEKLDEKVFQPAGDALGGAIGNALSASTLNKLSDSKAFSATGTALNASKTASMTALNTLSPFDDAAKAALNGNIKGAFIEGGKEIAGGKFAKAGGTLMKLGGEAIEQLAKKGDNMVASAQKTADDAAQLAGDAAKTTGQNSAELGRNMAREGRPVEAGDAAAHIVPSTGTKGHWAKGAESRALLERYGVNVNDAANGARLGHPRPHNQTHTGAFQNSTNARLNAVRDSMQEAGRGGKAIRKGLRQELRSIGRELEGQ